MIVFEDGKVIVLRFENESFKDMREKFKVIKNVLCFFFFYFEDLEFLKVYRKCDFFFILCLR